MKTKILFPLCFLLILIACIGFASAADTNNNTPSLEEPQTIEAIGTSNVIEDTGINEVVDTGVSEVQTTVNHTVPVKEVNNTDIQQDAIVSDNSANTSSNNTIKGPTKKSDLDIKGPKKCTLDIKGPKMSDKIKKQDQEIAKYYIWATKNKINRGHVILEIFKTHTLQETADIAAKVLSRMEPHSDPYCASDIKDMMRLMYDGSGRYEDIYGDIEGNYGSEIRLIMFQKNPTLDPFVGLHMFIFGVE